MGYLQFARLFHSDDLSAFCAVKLFPYKALYFPGVIPVNLLNVSVNALWEENPGDSDTSENEKSEYASIFLAAPTLALIMNSLNDTPTSFEKSFERYVRSICRYSAIDLTVSFSCRFSYPCLCGLELMAIYI